VEKLNFKEIFLKQDLDVAAELILTDRKHLENNPRQISKNDIISLLRKVNDGMVFNKI
jgi:succinate semialdehyde reductase